LQTSAPLAYKCLLYACGLYIPFLALTYITSAVRSIPGRGLPAVLAYLALVTPLFAKGMFLIRGMDIESRTTYFCVLFVPVIALVAFGQLAAGTRRRAASSPEAEQQAGD
jgi:hypothetical protein